MKRPADSLCSLISIFPSSDQEQSPRINWFEEEELIQLGNFLEKKRRLSVEQVKALEKNFEVENNLDSEKKLNLAKELGLHPRQVSIWFQNRRARSKTKQLEWDYNVLKTDYENIKLCFQNLQNDNRSLLKEIQELKTKLREDNITVQFSVPPASELPSPPSQAEAFSFPDFKDGFSHSDSSAIMNEDYSPMVAVSSPVVMLMAAASPTATGGVKPTAAQMFPKMEEHNFFTGDEACNFFSDEQAPTLHWWKSMAA